MTEIKPIPKKTKNNLSLDSNALVGISQTIDTYDLLINQMKKTDYFARFIGLSLAIHEDKVYDSNITNNNLNDFKMNWNLKCYKEESSRKLYTFKNIPEWLSCKSISKYIC